MLIKFLRQVWHQVTPPIVLQAPYPAMVVANSIVEHLRINYRRPINQLQLQAILHIASGLYYATNGCRLFNEPLLLSVNGTAVPVVAEHFSQNIQRPVKFRYCGRLVEPMHYLMRVSDLAQVSYIVDHVVRLDYDIDVLPALQAEPYWHEHYQPGVEITYPVDELSKYYRQAYRLPWTK